MNRQRVLRPSVVERYLHSAAVVDRERAESLIRGIEVLTRKVADLDTIPLDLLDRYERCLAQAHAANLLRLPTYSNLGEGE